MAVLAVVTVIAWMAIVCGISLLVFLAILLAPWHWIRPSPEPRRLDPDVETRLLLGEDPGALAEELDEREGEPSTVAELHPDDRT